MINVDKKKVVLITGASRGIGKSIVKDLMTYDNYELLLPKRAEMNLEDMNSVKDYLEEHRNIDILINNAGINIIKEIEKIDNASLEAMLNVNLVGPLQIIKSVVPFMKRNKSGNILNVSSIWGIRSKEMRTLYSMTKFALNGITKALAHELGPYNILINSICPGYVNTEMTMKNIPFEQQEIIKKSIPLRRFADPEEIADFIGFLISDKNKYITGQVMVIDGGFLS